MKNNRLQRTKTKVFMAMLMAAMLLSGCGSSAGKYDTAMSEGAVSNGFNADYATDDMYMAESTAEESYEEVAAEEKDAGGVKSEKDTVASNRKLIKRVNMSVETQEFETITQKIEDKVTALGGYMEDANIYGNSIHSSDTRRAQYTARIPVNKMDELVTAVAEISNVISKSQSATDVTLEYVDTQARKDALKIEQDRLMLLLEQADTLDTIIGLEKRLTEVRYELQELESKLRTYDNLVDFATVSIDVSEVKVYTPQITPEKTIWEKMTEGFVTSLQDVGLGLLNFIVGLVIALPYLVVWAIVITIIVLIIKVMIKRGKKKRELKKARKQAIMQPMSSNTANTQEAYLQGGKNEQLANSANDAAKKTE